MRKTMLVALAASLLLALVPSPVHATSGYPTYIHGHFPAKVCKGIRTMFAVTTHSKNSREEYILAVDFDVNSDGSYVMFDLDAETHTLQIYYHTWEDLGPQKWRVSAHELHAERRWGIPYDEGTLVVEECETTRARPGIKWGGDDEQTTPAEVELNFARHPFHELPYILDWDDPFDRVPQTIMVPPVEYLPDGSYEETYTITLQHKYANWGEKRSNGTGDGTNHLYQQYWPTVTSADGYAEMAVIDRPITHICPADPDEAPPDDVDVGGGI